MKKFFHLFLVIVFGCLSSTAQTNSCNLQLNTYKYLANTEVEPIQIKRGTIILQNVKTRRKSKVNLKNGIPFYSDLPEGDYKATFSIPNYKTTTKNFDLSCGNKTFEAASEVIFLWEGKAEQIVTMDGKIYTIVSEISTSTSSPNPNVNIVIPSYPSAAAAVKATGEVKVKVIINELGQVTNAVVISGHPLLREAAEKAAKESKFFPTILKGTRVKVEGILVYNFIS